MIKGITVKKFRLWVLYRILLSNILCFTYLTMSYAKKFLSPQTFARVYLTLLGLYLVLISGIHVYIVRILSETCWCVPMAHTVFLLCSNPQASCFQFFFCDTDDYSKSWGTFISISRVCGIYVWSDFLIELGNFYILIYHLSELSFCLPYQADIWFRHYHTNALLFCAVFSVVC